MSGTIVLPEINVVADEDLPLPPPAPKAPTPRQSARTKASLPAKVAAEPDPLPPPPAAPGPELSLPVAVLRQPRGGITVNGARADHLLIEMDVTNNRFFDADRFDVTLAIRETDPTFGKSFWQDGQQLDVELFCGFGVNEPPSTSLLAGRVDEVSIDLDRRTVRLAGRDHTGDLIETRIADKYPNKTASEVVRILAGMAGLSADVQETTALAGKYYNAQHVSVADETTAWSLITYLAEQEGFDAYVVGKTVHFKPPPDPVSAPRWTLVYEPGEASKPWPRAPLRNLVLTRSLTISRDVVVKVISWHGGKKAAVTGLSRTKLGGRSTSGQRTDAVNYVFRVPGLTQEQADAEAKRRAEDITKNLRSISFETAALPGLTCQSVIDLQGTGGSFDTRYNLDSIDWSISQEQGFTMTVRARNTTPDDTASL